MKVLMVTPYYFPTTIGGTESQIENISIKLNQLNIKTDVLTLNYVSKGITALHDDFEVINGLRVFRVPAARLPRPTFFVNHVATGFRRLMADYDFIHFHNDTDLTFPLLSFGIGTPKLFHCHCLDATYFDYKRNPVARQIFKRSADAFITFSKFLSESLLDLGVPTEKIRVLPNEVNTTKFKAGKEPRSENLLLFVGRLDPKKGIPILLQSLKFLKKPVKLVLIGPPSGYVEYSVRTAKLIEDARSNTIHEVLYLGSIGSSELLQWYQKASIFVLPSVSESFPMTILEALSCGAPVVASNVGAISDIVQDHKNGLLVPSKDPVKLAAALQSLLDDDGLRTEYGREGAKYVRKNFSSEVLIHRLIDIYRSLT
jgi:glycosyltransferase involved in cell wall biosynthesis